MNKYIKKYGKIVDKLIKKSFPILKNKKIIITELPELSKRYVAGEWNFLFFTWITIFKKCRKYSNKALVGLFAHELGHQEIIEKMRFLKKIIYLLKWIFSKKIKADFETKTDLLVIKKGYDNELIQLNKEALKGRTKAELKERNKKGYLNPQKIKSYIKKYKK